MMLDLVPLALGILVMLFALLECSLEALFDLFAINFRSRLAKAGFLRRVPVTMLSRILNDSVARLAKRAADSFRIRAVSYTHLTLPRKRIV